MTTTRLNYETAACNVCIEPGTIRVAALGALLLTGCVAETTGPVVRPMTELRTMRKGVCASAPVDSGMQAALLKGKRRIETCLQTGMPGTLMDDGRTPRIVTMVTGLANSPDANASNWQVEIWFNGAPMGKRMMTKVGLGLELSCSQGDCESWSSDVMEWSVPFSPGKYEFRYTCALDTSLVAINTITLEGTSPPGAPPKPIAPTAGAGAPVPEPSATEPTIGIRTTPTPAAIAALFQLGKPRGLFVTVVEKDGPADKAGIRLSDVILECNSRPTNTLADIHAVLAGAQQNAPVSCKLWNASGAKDNKPVYSERIVSIALGTP